MIKLPSYPGMQELTGLISSVDRRRINRETQKCKEFGNVLATPCDGFLLLFDGLSSIRRSIRDQQENGGQNFC
jgi:hypothetical protein